MRMRTALLATVCVGSLSTTSWAHPNHATEAGSSHGLVHYVTHPDHIAQGLILIGFLALVITIMRSARRLTPAYARAGDSQLSGKGDYQH